MDGPLPLSALLSQALVAFTIEIDNEAEHLSPHRTTRFGATAGAVHAPWLASLAMWSNCMRFVSEEGITVRELERLARTQTNLNGMVRWGYIRIGEGPATRGARRYRADEIIRPTRAGRMARETWPPLLGAIETRWRERFGSGEVDQLREALWAVARQFEIELPDCLPILGYGLYSSAPDAVQAGPDSVTIATSLPALLSKVLLAFAIEFERDGTVSLAISANVLRLAGDGGIRVRDLPRMSGVSKEAIAVALKFLETRGL
jgi:hypothetical protein